MQNILGGRSLAFLQILMDTTVLGQSIGNLKYLPIQCLVYFECMGYEDISGSTWTIEKELDVLIVDNSFETGMGMMKTFKYRHDHLVIQA